MEVNTDFVHCLFIQFGQVETIASGIIDEYPDLLRPHRKLFTGVLCTFMFLLGIPFVTQVSCPAHFVTSYECDSLDVLVCDAVLDVGCLCFTIESNNYLGE